MHSASTDSIFWSMTDTPLSVLKPSATPETLIGTKKRGRDKTHDRAPSSMEYITEIGNKR